MWNLEKGQHIFIAFQNEKAVLDSQLRPRMYTSLENADKWTPTVNKGKIEYVEYAPTLTPPNESLTWEELSDMVNEPVYIVELEGPKRNYWALVHQVSDTDAMFTSAVDLHDYGSRELYGKSWYVYRRPPEKQEGEA